MASFADRGGWWVVGQVALFIAIAAAAWSGGPTITDGAVWSITVGAVLLIIGLGLGAGAFAALGFVVSVFPAPDERSSLTTRGVYRFARHPIYGGVIVSFGGGMLLVDSLVGLVLSSMLVPFFLGKSAHEERLLVDRYPEYVDYQRRVRKRLLPFVV